MIGAIFYTLLFTLAACAWLVVKGWWWAGQAMGRWLAEEAGR
jgi:hypothetical protein